MWTTTLYWLNVLNASCSPGPTAGAWRFSGAGALRETSAHGAFTRGAEVNVSWHSVPCALAAADEPGVAHCVVAANAPATVALKRPPAAVDGVTRADLLAANATAGIATVGGVAVLVLLLPNAKPPEVCPEGLGWDFACECVDVGMARCRGDGPAVRTGRRCPRYAYGIDADPFGATAAIVLVATVVYCLRGASAAAALGVAAMLPVSAIVTQLPAVTAGKAGAAAAAGVMLGAHSGGLAAFGPTDEKIGMIIAIVAGAAAVGATDHAGLYALVAFAAGAGAAVSMAATLGAQGATRENVAAVVLGMAVAPLIACVVTAAQTAAPALTPPMALAVATAVAGGCAALGAAHAPEATPAISEQLVADDVESAPEPAAKPPAPPLRALAAVAAAAAMAPAYWPGVFRTTFAYAAVVITSTAADVAGRAAPGGEAVVAAAAGGVMMLATAANVAGESSDLSEIAYAAVVLGAAFVRGRVVTAVAVNSDAAGRVAVVRAMVLGGCVGALGGVPALVVWG